MSHRPRIALAISMALLCSGPAAFAETHDAVRTRSGSFVLNSFQHCVRTQWDVGQDVCAPKPPAKTASAIVPPQPLALEERTVYFGFNQATLTPEAKAKLDTLANTLTSLSSVKAAHVVGYADRMGQASYNEQLSRKRAEATQRYIVSRGFVHTDVADTRWLGETAPVTSCPDTLSREALISCLQKDRRVEVEIEYQPER